jgi:excisionase family DNA binding protein
VPPALVEVLRAAAGELSAGHAVTLLASRTLLTPAEAARLLGLSRPFVVRLLDDGTLPSEHLATSRHRVVRLEDVLAFAERRRRRQEGRRRIAEAVDDAGLPY